MVITHSSALNTCSVLNRCTVNVMTDIFTARIKTAILFNKVLHNIINGCSVRIIEPIIHNIKGVDACVLAVRIFIYFFQII